MRQTVKQYRVQDATWIGGRHRPRPHCVTWRPSSAPPPPKKKGRGSSTHFSVGPCLWPNGWVYQDATWYTEVELGPGHIVLDGDLAPLPRKGTAPPLFGPCLLWQRSPILATAELLLINLCGNIVNSLDLFLISNLQLCWHRIYRISGSNQVGKWRAGGKNSTYYYDIEPTYISQLLMEDNNNRLFPALCVI